METQLEDVYSPLAAHREHNPGEHIRYRLAGEPGEYSGKILWMCEATREVSMRYIVERDGGARPSLTWCFLPQSLATWRLTIRI